jgi:alpha-beta hydrolase superfamily lysophospholipase
MKKENQFMSKDGKTMIHYTIWYPENCFKGIIQLTHGMTEYMKNYEEFAQFLCKNDFLVIGQDQLGHGHSIQRIEELGYFSKRDSIDILVDDMYTVMEKAKLEYPNLPYFLFGHSFGSFLARIFSGMHGNELNGLILTGTGNANPKSIKSALRLVRAIRITKKANHRSKLVLKTIFGPYSKRIENPKNGCEWLSRDEKSIIEYLEDPLNNFVYTLNGFYTILYAALKMQEKEIFSNTPKNLPIFMISGSEDPVGDYGKKILEVYDLYKAHKIEDVTVKIYQGARHNVLTEINRRQVMEDCMTWIMERL